MAWDGGGGGPTLTAGVSGGHRNLDRATGLEIKKGKRRHDSLKYQSLKTNKEAYPFNLFATDVQFGVSATLDYDDFCQFVLHK